MPTLSIYQSNGLKILEMYQYTIILVSSTICISYIVHKIYLYYELYFNNDLVKKDNITSFGKTFIKLITELFLTIIAFVYISKFIKKVPSISNYLSPSYIPYRNFEVIIHIALLHVLIELHPEINNRIDNIYKILKQKNI